MEAAPALGVVAASVAIGIGATALAVAINNSPPTPPTSSDTLTLQVTPAPNSKLVWVSTPTVQGLNIKSSGDSGSITLELQQGTGQNTRLVLPNQTPAPAPGSVLTVVNSTDPDEVVTAWQPGSGQYQVSRVVVVTKDPVEGQFGTIKGALASISDATQDEPYVVMVAPGTYTENEITVGPFITLRGSGPERTIVSVGANDGVYLSNGSGLGAINISCAHAPATGVVGVTVLDQPHDQPVIVSDVVISGALTAFRVSGSNDVQVDGTGLRVIDAIDVGIECIGTGGVDVTVQLTNANVTMSALNPASTCVVLDNATCGIATGRLEGGDKGAVLNNGASGTLVSVVFESIGTTAIEVPAGGTGAPHLVLTDPVFDPSSTTQQIDIQNNACTGYASGYTAVPLVMVVPDAPFFVDNQDRHLLTIGTGGGQDFVSIQDAITYINGLPPSLAPSLMDPTVILVDPGTHSEPALVLPDFVHIRGVDRDSCTIVPDVSVTGGTLLTLGQNSEVASITIEAPTGAGSVAIRYDGSNTPLRSVQLQDVHLIGDDESNTTLCLFTTDLGPTSSCFIVANNVVFDGMFATAFDLDNTLGTNVSTVMSNVGWYNTATFSSDVDVYRFRGVDNGLGVRSVVAYMSDVLLLDESSAGGSPSHITALLAETGCTLSVTNLSVHNIACTLESVATAVPQDITVRNLLVTSSNPAVNPGAVSIAGTNVSGSIGGVGDISTVTNNSPAISVHFTDLQTGDTSISGELVLGQSTSTITNASETLWAATAVGIVSGGALTAPTLSTAQVATGSGYVVVGGVVQYIEWTAPLAVPTIPASATSYIVVVPGPPAPTAQIQLSLPSNNAILIGCVHTNSGNIVYVQQLATNTKQVSTTLGNASTSVFGNVFSGGGTVSLNGTSSLDIVSGQYWNGARTWLIASQTNFPMVFLSDSGTVVSASTTTVDTTNYNPGGSGLAPITAGRYVRHALYTAEGNTYLVVYATSEDVNQDDAQLPLPPPYFDESIVLLGAIVVQGGTGLVDRVEDLRPRADFRQEIATTAPTNDHQLLINRGAIDAHAQYLLHDGSGSMTGVLNMGANAITNVTTISDTAQPTQNIILSSISTRLVPGGQDPLPTAAPVDISTANNIGVAASFSRSDHVHSHGDLPGLTLHALATGSGAGFMSAGDFTLLGTSTSTPTANALTMYDASSSLNTVNINVDNDIVMGTGTVATVTLSTNPSTSVDQTLVLPESAGAAGTFLQTAGASGLLTWATPVQPMIQVRSTMAGNVNLNTPISVDWDLSDFADPAVYQHNNAGTQSDIVTFLVDGIYLVYAQISHFSNATRINLSVQARLNGSGELQGGGYSGYTRGQSGSTTSAGGFTTAYQFTAGDTLEIVIGRAAGNGTATLQAGESVLRIVKLG